jgi:topoisomerase-4 subunit A
VIAPQVIEVTLPMDVPTIENSSESELLSKETKKQALLKKSIQKKKENTNDDTQQSLF